MFRVANGVMMVVFLAGAAVQYNDPDRFLWVQLYLYPAVLSGYALSRRYSVLSPIGAVSYFCGFVYLMRYWGHPWIEIEEVREAFGLLICAAWMAVLSLTWWKARPAGGDPAPASETVVPPVA